MGALIGFLLTVFCIIFLIMGFFDPVMRPMLLACAACGITGSQLIFRWVDVAELKRGLPDTLSDLGKARARMWFWVPLFVLSCIWFHDLEGTSWRGDRILFHTSMPPIAEQKYLSMGSYGWKATKADEGGVLNPEFINQPRVLIWKDGDAGHPYYQEAYRIPQGVLFCSFFNKHGNWGHLDWSFVPWGNFDYRLRRALREAPEIQPSVETAQYKEKAS